MAAMVSAASGKGGFELPKDRVPRKAAQTETSPCWARDGWRTSNDKCKKCTGQAYWHRHSTPSHWLSQSMQALVTSRLDYYNTILAAAPRVPAATCLEYCQWRAVSNGYSCPGVENTHNSLLPSKAFSIQPKRFHLSVWLLCLTLDPSSADFC